MLTLLLIWVSFATANETPLVFIHGFKGSQLVDDKNQVRWVTALQTLGFNSMPINLPEEWDDEGNQRRDLLRSQDVLKNIFVVPYFVGEKVYGPWIEMIQAYAKGKNRPFYIFHYDWRRDNGETSLEFESFLEKIRGNSRVDVIAHSMGGLISLAVLNRRQDLIKHLVFAGVPFHGGTGFLEDMHVGVPAGLNKTILSPEVLFSFPSVYTLFSELGEGFVDRTGKPLYIDLYTARSWVEFKLGVFARSDRDKKKDESFLFTALAAAKEFRMHTHVAPDRFPPLLVILGKKYPTLSAVQRDGPKAKYGWDFESIGRVPGDGRVTSTNLPPEGTKYDLYFSDHDHSNLLNDPKVFTEITKMIEKD